MMLEHGPDAPSWRDLGVDVASAGTAALVGRQLDPAMRRSLGELGVTPDDSFVARQVSPSMLEAATVVLAATRDHRAQLFRLAPSALRRTFTIAEFAARSRSWTTSGDTVADRLLGLVEHATRSRGEPVFARAVDEDVPDPFRRSQRLHRQAARRLWEAAGDLTRAVTP